MDAGIRMIASVCAHSQTGDNAAKLIGSLVGSGLMFWIANNINKQAGK